MNEYRWTSGRMLHLFDCPHFEDEMPPREATEAELRTLPVCSDCEGHTAHGSGNPSASTVGALAEFTCPSCHLLKATTQRTASGVCRDCA
jgi:hypothetical protein